jgi:HD superfamily phosphohydrolase
LTLAARCGKNALNVPVHSQNRVVMDAIHGLVEVVDQRFWRVIDSPEIQRLRWIRQTGLAFLVYPGAEHSRFAHVLGAYGIARRAFRHLRSQLSYSNLFSPSKLDDDLELAFTTAALCHDLGHTAFSHVLEPLLLPENLPSHEDCTLALLREGEVGRRIKTVVCDLEQVIDLLGLTHWHDILCKLISGPVDVDRWDYLLRDASGAGVVYGRYDLDRLIHSLDMYLGSERRPRLMIEAHRGLVALRHFLFARRSMYEQVYWHATVRGAERLLRAVIERACDPSRLRGYRLNSLADVPRSLHSVLRGKKPSIGEFLETDDATIIVALKQWRRASKDPLLAYLAGCFLDRNLFKEIHYDAAHFDARPVARDAVKRSLATCSSGTLAALGRLDETTLDYLVLVDTCDFKTHDDFEGVLFDTGEAKLKTIDDLSGRPEYDIVSGLGPFSRNRLYVPAEVSEAVQTAVSEEEQK